MARTHKVHKFSPKPDPPPDEIEHRAAAEIEARAKVHPPHVYVTKIERNHLQAPDIGHGIIVHFATSYELTDAEVRRLIIRGARCHKCEDESWLS